MGRAAELAAESAAGDLEDNAFHLILEVAAMSALRVK